MAGYDFRRVEESVLSFWKERRVYEKARAAAKQRGADKKPFYFLDGPPYTSGKVHLGTAWNKALKDAILRYKRMRGFDVWDRAGYDMHGLPTEHATQDKLGLKTKEEIKGYGIAKFIRACKELCLENMRVMNDDFARLGVWMDFENAYQSISEEFIEGEWWLVKRAHEEGRLYEGLKTMTWCPSCASALAKHECEYQTVKEPSIFVKFRLEGEEETYLIIWTTTPWTIPFNLAIMANPELPYVKCAVRHEGKEEHWILSAQLAGPVIRGVVGASYKVEEEFPGRALEGKRYLHPFAERIPSYDLLRREHPRVHTVVMSSEYVDTSAGSGLVHCAPGCGPEDYEVGVANGLPPFNTLDEQGVFRELGVFDGKLAKRDDQFFIKALEEGGALLAIVPVEHEYAHCWRCHQPVIYRATRQWFFKVEDMKERLVAENDRIRWVPRAAYNAFDSWLRNLRDNSITKQRYWGTPLPVWQCDACNRYVVIGSRKELAEHAGSLPEDLHKPWIDEVAWECECGGVMRRHPDILDVWVDAGTVSWNSLGYPSRKELFQKLFPADFILEGKDQIRGWFNLLHITSMIAFGKASFRNAYMHGFVNDSLGRKMSKSLGNYILPNEVIEKYGADTFRYYMIGAANPGLDMNYNFDDVKLKHRNLVVFWNIHNFLLELRRSGVPLERPAELGVEERFILSRLHSTIREATRAMEEYRINELPLILEQFLLELSREYIKLVRERISTGPDEEKKRILSTIFTTYLDAITMFAVVAPMFGEQVYQELRSAFPLEEESIHLRDWPASDERLIDEELEGLFLAGGEVVSAILAARDQAKLGVRWPLPEVLVETSDEVVAGAVTKLGGVIRQQANVKRLSLGAPEGLRRRVEPVVPEVRKGFGRDAERVLALIKERAGGVLDFLSKTEQESFKLGPFLLRREHARLVHELPKGWRLAAFPRGRVFVKTLLSRELEGEGYARELVRRIQQLRKEAGLQKGDAIELFIEASGLEWVVKAFREEVVGRTGAAKLHLGRPPSTITNRREERIRKERLLLGLKVLGKLPAEKAAREGKKEKK